MSSSLGVPLDSEGGRAFFQERLAAYGRLVFALFLSFFVLVNVAYSLLAPRDVYLSWLTHLSNLPYGAAQVVLLGLWLACRRGPLGQATLEALDAVGVWLVCFMVSLSVVLFARSAGRHPEGMAADRLYTMHLVFTNVLVARAVFVPSAPRRTIRLGLACAVPVLVAAAVLQLAPAENRSGLEAIPTVTTTLWCLCAVALSTLMSRLLYGLRARVREARQLGQYTLEEKLGEGGMGIVFRASHAMLRRPAAVKLVSPERAGQEALRRFEREVQLTARLSHPNTVVVFDYGRTPDGVFYYAMEYLEGIDLDELVRADGPQAPARVLHVLRQVCGALAEAHGVGLIHRDVKPANVMLCERGGVPDVAKVLDFGLARAVQGAGASSSITSVDAITGTPLYLAPEAIVAPDRMDARSDIYALGAVAYYLLSGHHVFEAATLVEVCSHHLHTKPAPLSERLGRPVPRDLESLVLRCLEKDPTRRPASVRTLLDELSDCRDMGSWREEEAQEWWARRGTRIMQERSRESRAEADTGTMEPLSVSLEGRTAGIVVTRAGTPDHSIQPPPRQTSPS